MNRSDQMCWLERVWRGCCQDPQCPNYPLYGVPVGTKLRIGAEIEAIESAEWEGREEID